MQPTEEQLANRAAWIAALRGGAYKQGRANLSSNWEYCCLGVDAKIAGALRPFGCASECFGKTSSHGLVPPLWFSQRHGTTPEWAEAIIYAAVEWNDAQRLSFEAIADKLEHEFPRIDAGILSIGEEL